MAARQNNTVQYTHIHANTSTKKIQKRYIKNSKKEQNWTRATLPPSWARRQAVNGPVFAGGLIRMSVVTTMSLVCQVDASSPSVAQTWMDEVHVRSLLTITLSTNYNPNPSPKPQSLKLILTLLP